MFHLENAGLRVSLLDPIADRKLLGTRYCTGGYIWQVRDGAKGDLLSGPRFPDPEPPVFDGQGLPEVFETALGAATAKPGEDVWVLGVGRVKRVSPVRPFHVRDNPLLLEPATWKVSQAGAMATFVSRQAFKDWDLHLERKVLLKGRVLVSSTLIKNQGKADAPIRWFAHPFFPHAGAEVGRLSVDCEFPTWVPAAGGFRIENGFARSRLRLGGGLLSVAEHPFRRAGGYPAKAPGLGRGEDRMPLPGGVAAVMGQRQYGLLRALLPYGAASRQPNGVVDPLPPIGARWHPSSRPA
jgi:hypothetical protein